MNAADRVALHHRLVDGFIDAFTHCVERKRVQYPDEWVLTQDAVVVSPNIGAGEPFPLGQYVADSGLTLSDIATVEWALYWRDIPDFRCVEAGTAVVDETGFAWWWKTGGTARDGRFLSFHENDFVRTNEQGHITRWEAFFDWNEMAPVMQLASGGGPGMSWWDYIAAVMAYLPHIRGVVSDETMKNWEATPLFQMLVPQ